MENPSEIEVIDKYRSELNYNLNSKGFIQIALKNRYLETITKKDIDSASELFSYASKSIKKQGFTLEEPKK